MRGGKESRCADREREELLQREREDVATAATALLSALPSQLLCERKGTERRAARAGGEERVKQKSLFSRLSFPLLHLSLALPNLAQHPSHVFPRRAVADINRVRGNDYDDMIPSPAPIRVADVCSYAADIMQMM